MARSTEFTSLEMSLESTIEEIIGENTYEDFAIELMDVRSGLVDSPAKMVLNNSVGLALMNLHGVTEDDITARQSAYRAYVFAYASSQMVATYDFELDISGYVETALHNADPQDAVISSAEKYLSSRPIMNGYIDAFVEELDVSESGRWHGLVKTISAAMFKLAETGMFETYVEERSKHLEEYQ